MVNFIYNILFITEQGVKIVFFQLVTPRAPQRDGVPENQVSCINLIKNMYASKISTPNCIYSKLVANFESR